MIQLHFGVIHSKIGKSIGVLCLVTWNYVNYANMEGFRRDSHNCYSPTYKSKFTLVHFTLFLNDAKDDKTPHHSLCHSVTTSTYSKP